jgi:hypothetical protein
MSNHKYLLRHIYKFFFAIFNENVMPQPMHNNSLFETLCILLVMTNKQRDRSYTCILHKKIYKSDDMKRDSTFLCWFSTCCFVMSFST